MGSKSLGLIMVLFLIIALLSIGLIFSPVVVHIGNEASAPSAITLDGMMLRAEAWKEYPEYNIGLGFIAGFAFLGAIFVCRTMYLLQEAPQNQNLGGCK